MSFNENELLKIEKATSGFFKKTVRSAISEAISELRPKVEDAKKLPKDERGNVLKHLLKNAAHQRKKAILEGATSYGHPFLASKAVCESWLQELVFGTDDSISRVEEIIDRLHHR